MNEADQPNGVQTKKPSSKHLFFSLLLLCILLVTGFSFMISPAFSVGTVSVQGNTYMTEDEIFQLAGIPGKINIFRLNTGEIQSRLCKDLRIEQAQVVRHFPSTIAVEIIERQPMAYVACDYGYVEVDRDGMVLAAHKTIKHIRVPMITGIILHNLYVGDKVEDATLTAVWEYLDCLGESALNQLSEIDISNRDQLIAYTTSSVQIRMGNAERMAEKAKLTQGFLEELKITKLSIEYIDFNFASPFIKFKK